MGTWREGGTGRERQMLYLSLFRCFVIPPLNKNSEKMQIRTLPSISPLFTIRLSFLDGKEGGREGGDGENKTCNNVRVI